MIRAIALDLDDTLIDTSRILIPMAAKATYEKMVEHGLKTSFEVFEKHRSEGVVSSISHQKIFRNLAEKFAIGHVEAATQAGIQEFYNPKIPKQMPLLPGALENLKFLSKKYDLFLVTSGVSATQKEKVRAAGIEIYFKKVYALDSLKKERKRTAFNDILTHLNIEPSELLSVGNRLSQEIHDAKELGCQTCYFKFGEHVGEMAQNDFEVPDFTVEHHKELITTCRL